MASCLFGSSPHNTCAQNFNHSLNANQIQPMNTERPTNRNESQEMTPTDNARFSNRRWSLVLFLAVLVGIAQFGLGQFPAWVLAAPFVALLFMDFESAWKAGSGSQTLASSMASGGVLSQSAAALVFHGVVIGAVMTAASSAGDSPHGPAAQAITAKPAGGCGSGGICGGGPATAALAKAAGAGGCGSGGCGSGAGGCGSGGCGSGAGGCGSSCGAGHAASAAKPAVSTTAPSPYPLATRPSTEIKSVPLPAPAAPMPNAMRPGQPPMSARPSAPPPGVTNQPVAISPQAMAVISAQPQVTAPRPTQNPSPVPAPAGKAAAPANPAPPTVPTAPPAEPAPAPAVSIQKP